jgi:hypothetical protein
MPMAAGGGAGGNMLAFMAEAAVVAGYRQALGAAGLEIDFCEPDATAAVRTVELGLRWPGAAAAVYVSPTCSEMVFLEAGRVRYYRRLDLGLAGSTDASDADGLADPETGDPSLTRFFASVTSAQRVEADPLADLALEVKRSLQYYARAYASAPQPQKILLLGDSPALERLQQVIHDDLHLETEYFHPLHRYPHAPAITDAHLVSSGGQYSVALGAALWPLADSHVATALNLRAHDEAQLLARQAPRYLTAALSGSVAMALVALVASVSLSARLSQAYGELNAAEAGVRAATAERESSVLQLRQARIATDRLRRQAMPVPQLLIRLGSLVPESLALTNVDLNEDGSLALEGEARTPQQVNRFLQQLFDDSRFRPPDLDTLDSNGQDGMAHFKVRTGLAGYGKAEVKGNR